jgi:hypothetical protein
VRDDEGEVGAESALGVAARSVRDGTDGSACGCLHGSDQALYVRLMADESNLDR